MFERPLLLAYLIGVLVLTMVVGLRVWFSLSRVAFRRREGVESRRRFDAVQTDSPLDDPKTDARTRALESIDKQFSVTRRTLLPMLLLLTAAALALPFLDLVPAATLSLVVGSVTIIGGVAARPFLENAVAGLVLSYSRSLSIGDTVKFDGMYGTIEDITTTHTTIKLWDWRRFVMPNSETLRTTFINYSLFDRYVWASVDFYVGYDADISIVEEIAKTAATRSARYAPHEPPKFWVMEMEPTGVRCMVAAWADTPSDAWGLTHDIRTALIGAFHEAGVWTQMPQRVEAKMTAQEGHESTYRPRYPERRVDVGTSQWAAGPAGFVAKGSGD